MLWEEIGLITSPKLLTQFCHWTSNTLLLSPVAVKRVARCVYGLGQLYDSFCLSAASERLYQLQSQVAPYSHCVVVVLPWSLGEAAESSGVCCAVLMYSAAICARSIHCNYCLPSNRLLRPKFEPSSDVVFTAFFFHKAKK